MIGRQVTRRGSLDCCCASCATATCSATTPSATPTSTRSARRARRSCCARSRAIRAVSGYTPCVFRPPYGDYDASVLQHRALARALDVLWNVDPADYTQPGTAAIEQRVLAQVRPGSIIISHDGGGPRGADARRLPGDHRKLRARGYRIVTVLEMLGYRPVYVPCIEALRRDRPAAAKPAPPRARSSRKRREGAGGSALTVLRRDRRRLDAASDAPLHRARDVRLAAPLDRAARSPRTSCPIEATIAAMDAAGVDFGVLMRVARRRRGRDDLQRRGRRLGGRPPGPLRGRSPRSPLDRPMEAVRELRRCVRRARLRRAADAAVAVGGAARPTGASTRSTRRAWSWACPFCTQVGHTGPLRPSEPGTADPLHRPDRDRLPGADDRGRALGYPWTEEMIAVARKHENVYIDTSAYTTRRLPPGADRLHAHGQRLAQGAVRQQLPDDRSRPRRSRAWSGSSWTRTATSALPARERAPRVRGCAAAAAG